MKTIFKKTEETLSRITKDEPLETIMKRFSEAPINNPEQIPNVGEYTKESKRNINAFLEDQTKNKYPNLFNGNNFEEVEELRGNIENYIGMTQIPTGIMGPLHVKGTTLNENVFIPLATSEGALIASYHRGAKACSLSGGITSVCMNEAVYRSPLFKFNDLPQLFEFLFWFNQNIEKYYEIVGEMSNHAKLEDITSVVEGNTVIISFEYYTGDASGQNMVTICTQAICDFIMSTTPVKPTQWFIESNYSGDKKASAVSFTSVRGKKVTAECVVKKEIVEGVLKSTPEKMEKYWKSSTIAAIQSVTIGAQGHYANGLAAVFLACGQDVACVSEASVGITRMEVTENGDLYCSVTLPNLIVGTVGGGTSLPTQQECLNIMGCLGQGKSRRFAEICGALVLAGELSIASALSVGHFTNAHQSLGRKK
jgi:hydroxymethylglutaryl-CoA reductase (NADPH)